MKDLNDGSDLDHLFDNNNTHFYLSSILKAKDYKKLNQKLKIYQNLAYDIQTPNPSDVKHLFQMQANMQQLSHTLNEINLSFDQMAQDFNSIGFKKQAEAITAFLEIIKMLNQHMVKEIKRQFHRGKAEHLTVSKLNSGVCQFCQESQEATLIKRIKTQFGLDFKDDEATDSQRKKREQQDLILREKEQFIDQLNLLLNKKDSLLNVVPETWRYKQLLSSLNKMSEVFQRTEGKKYSIYNGQAVALEDRQSMEKQYEHVLSEVKEILNSKFREGYSNRVKSMLDKFQIVLKEDTAKKVQKKVYVNMRDIDTQTPSTPLLHQVRVLKDVLAKKEIELQGLKQAKIRLQQRVARSNQSELKAAKEINANIINLMKNDEKMQLLNDKSKENDELKFQIIKLTQIIDKRQRQSTSNKSKIYRKTISQEDRFYKNLLNSSVNKEIEVKLTKQTQTDTLIMINNVEYLLDQQLVQKYGKKKLLKKLSKHSLSSLFLENQLGRKINDIASESKSAIHLNVMSVTVLPTKNSKLSDMTIEEQKQEEFGQLMLVKKSSQNKLKKVTKLKKDKLKGSEKTKEVNIHDTRIEKPEVQQQEKKNLKKSNFASNEKLGSRQSSKLIKQNNRMKVGESTTKFRLNPPKAENSTLKNDHSTNTISNIIGNRDGVVKINKYQNQRNSRNIDRQKVKQIVALLKMQKNANPITTRSKYSNFYDRIDSSETNVRYSTDRTVNEDRFDQKTQYNKQEQVTKENISQGILTAKLIIQAEYSYLKASGFIEYLLSLEKRMSLTNKNTSKYKFEFTHLTESDLVLFGGAQELGQYYKKIGIWKLLLQEENQLVLNYRFRNFAQKISKYFFLLKKMNRQFFQEYSSFIFNPFQFAMSYFGSETRSEICRFVENVAQQTKQQGQMVNEQTMTRIMVRLIKYHQTSHGDCQHIPEFLAKVGYYRYTI